MTFTPLDSSQEIGYARGESKLIRTLLGAEDGFGLWIQVVVAMMAPKIGDTVILLYEDDKEVFLFFPL